MFDEVSEGGAEWGFDSALPSFVREGQDHARREKYLNHIK
jgi:hypothetical protein